MWPSRQFIIDYWHNFQDRHEQRVIPMKAEDNFPDTVVGYDNPYNYRGDECRIYRADDDKGTIGSDTEKNNGNLVAVYQLVRVERRVYNTVTVHNRIPVKTRLG